MPKSCVVPECRGAEAGRESYYKFPLHDKVRLKQWLTNMNVENFFPTKNQYLCSKHFKASCFQIRWGIRYLRHDAVPTIFSSSPVAGRVQVTKSRTLNSMQNPANEVYISNVSPLILGEAQVLPDTLTIALDPNPLTGQISINGAEVLVKHTDPSAVMGAVNLVPLVHFVESFDGLSLALAPSQGFQSVALPIKVAGEHLASQGFQSVALPIKVSGEHLASSQGFQSVALPIKVAGEHLVSQGFQSVALPIKVAGEHLASSQGFQSVTLPIEVAGEHLTSQGFQSVTLPIEVAGEHQIQQIPLMEPVGFLTEEHIATTTLQHDYGQVLQSVGDNVSTIIEITEVSNPDALVVENISIEPFFEAGLPTPPPATMTTEDVMSYLETMQTATLVPVPSSGPLPPLIPSQETILSSSTDRPIASTVPIVSKRSTEVSCVGVSEDLCTAASRELDGRTEMLSTAELVSVVVNLQKKVTALQQRHQKHCSKLEVMEGVVDQLKKENLIPDDKLNFLELACLNSIPIQTENGTETIAIVCEDEDQALMYTLPFQAENGTILHITEQ